MLSKGRRLKRRKLYRYGEENCPEGRVCGYCLEAFVAGEPVCLVRHGKEKLLAHADCAGAPEGY